MTRVLVLLYANRVSNMADTIQILTFLLFYECLYSVEEFFFFKTLIYAASLLMCIKYLAAT